MTLFRPGTNGRVLSLAGLSKHSQSPVVKTRSRSKQKSKNTEKQFHAMTVIAKYMWDVESSVRGVDIQPSTKRRPDMQSMRKSSSPHAKLQFNTHTYPAREKLHDEKNQTAGTNSAKHTLVLHAGARVYPHALKPS